MKNARPDEGLHARTVRRRGSQRRASLVCRGCGAPRPARGQLQLGGRCRACAEGGTDIGIGR